MILYHGSNTDIAQIDLAKGLTYKDFGNGFYLTPERATAVRMAQKKTRLFGGIPTLISYDFNVQTLPTDLKVKRFPERASIEWFLFIDANRDRQAKHPVHDYDIVIGPIADDGVVLQITNFREGIFTPEQAAKQLQDKYLDQQYYFGTERALQYLHKLKSETL